MYLTKDEILKRLQENASNCAMDIGIDMASMESEDLEKTWSNIVEVVAQFFHHDEDELIDFFEEVEEYSKK